MKMNWRGHLLAKTVLAGVASISTPALLVGAAAFVAPAATAQDYSNANLSGTVVDKDGAPVAGASVKALSQAQGFERTTTTNERGEFRIPLVPQGAYTVTVAKSGLQTTSAKDLRVQVGSDNSYRLVLEPATSSEVVVVTGVRPQAEFTQTTTGVSIDVEDFNKRMPIAQNITAISMLAPTAVPIDPVFAVGSGQLLAPASIGGASGAENAFFVNGLNITNFVNGIGGATVPFYFYQTVDVKTGGYQAEFGRATGAVINAVTKSGSNQFKFAAHLDYEPEDLREHAKNTYQQQYSLYNQDYQAATLEGSGPIIPDHLFFYGLAQWQKKENTSATTAGTYVEDKMGDPFYAFKLDGYITDTQHLEFTYFDTTAQRKRDTFRFDPATDTITRPRTSFQTLKQGGENYVGRYTGTFFEKLTVSAAYGRSEVDQAVFTDLVSVPLVQDQRTGTTKTLGAQTTSASTIPFLAEREFYRADLDYTLDLFGEHHLRGGYDQEDTTLTEQSVRNGGANYIVSTTGTGGSTSLGLGPNQEYIQRRVFISGGGFDGQNKAFYVQDSWDATDRLNVQLGWRQDKFSIADPNGQEFLSFQDEQAIRLGASYDVFGDKSAKLYGYYGRFYLPAASNTSFRAAAPAIDFTEYFLPSGGGKTFGAFDSFTGLPTAGLGPQITSATGATGLVACPRVGGPVSSAGALACTVRNDGHSPNRKDAIADDVKSTYEDQYILGYSVHLNQDWETGIELLYNSLGRVSEDVLIEQGLISYCHRNNIAGCDAKYANQGANYRILNPGFGAMIDLSSDPLPNGQTKAYLTAEDLGFPKAKRDYIGLTWSFDRKFDGVWGLSGSYTLSRSEGNFEGNLNSDIGQTDAGITEDFDFQAFVPGQYGLLPNHHAHQLKLNGAYSPFENFLIGGNLSVISPRHYGCIGAANEGYADGHLANDSYGIPANARFCNGLVVDRGSVFTADWVYRFDMSFRYTLPEKLMPVGSITLRADIFNVFNLDAAPEANEFGEIGIGAPSDTYRMDQTRQTPRYFRFGIDYEF